MSGYPKRSVSCKIQVISNTGVKSPCSTKGESYRFSPRWSNGPQLHGGNPIGFVPAPRGGVYIKSMVVINLKLLHEKLAM
jgi:hypothetical protein